MTPDIYIVQKQTALERYTRRPLNIDFFEYLEKAGQDVQGLVEAHDAHTAARTSLLAFVDSLGVSYDLMNLDELHEKRALFFDESNASSGFNPLKKLVIALGGDGTLLHASHYVGNDVTLLGVNSCPGSSVGALCAATKNDFEIVLKDFFAGIRKPTSVRRLKVQVPGLQNLPLGLNDVLFSNRHPGATSRYQLTIQAAASGEVLESERHLSSGLWVSAPAGSTAAISSYGLPKLDLTASKYLMAVREAYLPAGHQFSLLKKVLDGETEKLEVFCRIRQGIVCVDGADSCVYLGFGDAIEVSLPKSCELRLLVKATET